MLMTRCFGDQKGSKDEDEMSSKIVAFFDLVYRKCLLEVSHIFITFDFFFFLTFCLFGAKNYKASEPNPSRSLLVSIMTIQCHLLCILTAFCVRIY